MEILYTILPFPKIGVSVTLRHSKSYIKRAAFFVHLINNDRYNNGQTSEKNPKNIHFLKNSPFSKSIHEKEMTFSIRDHFETWESNVLVLTH